MAVLARPRRSYTFGTVLRYVLLAVVVIYLVLPLFSTILFSLATVWSKTILPEGYTLNAYREFQRSPDRARHPAQSHGNGRHALRRSGARRSGAPLGALASSTVQTLAEFLAIVPGHCPALFWR